MLNSLELIHFWLKLLETGRASYCFICIDPVWIGYWQVLWRDTLPEERIEWLRQELLHAIARCSNGPAFIITKLCQAVRDSFWSTVAGNLRANLKSTVNSVRYSSGTSELVKLHSECVSVLGGCRTNRLEYSHRRKHGDTWAPYYYSGRYHHRTTYWRSQVCWLDQIIVAQLWQIHLIHYRSDFRLCKN